MKIKSDLFISNKPFLFGREGECKKGNGLFRGGV